MTIAVDIKQQNKQQNDQLGQKAMMSCRQNDHCQRPKTSRFDFVSPFAFEFENFLLFIMEGIHTL